MTNDEVPKSERSPNVEIRMTVVVPTSCDAIPRKTAEESVLWTDAPWRTAATGTAAADWDFVIWVSFVIGYFVIRHSPDGVFAFDEPGGA